MKQLILFLVIPCLVISCNQHQKSIDFRGDQTTKDKDAQNLIQVLTLGTFHFNFPNLDLKKIDDTDKIDVLSHKYQEELKLIVKKLERFRPTIIVIEREPEFQEKYDSLYQSYLEGQHQLTRDEEQQIGFRLAKKLKLNRLYCADSWGADYEDVKQVLEGEDSVSKQKFMNFFFNNADSILQSSRKEKHIFKTQGILAELKRTNRDKIPIESLGDYLVGIFKYETQENEYFGVDFTTGWWFSRNLRIFRNIQRINATPEDRILVIYGAGHMNLLNLFFESSPEYNLHAANDYL